MYVCACIDLCKELLALRFLCTSQFVCLPPRNKTQIESMASSTSEQQVDEDLLWNTAFALRLEEDATAHPSPIRCPLLPRQHPKHSGRNTLILDIDDTLLKSSFQKGFTVLRPGVIPFLREVHELFEVVFWTASSERYGRAVWRAMELAGAHLDGKPVNPPSSESGEADQAPPLLGLFKHHTDAKERKSLHWLGRDVEKCILLDDTPGHFAVTPRQGIRAQRTKGTPVSVAPSSGTVIPVAPVSQDNYLQQILPLLRALAIVENPTRELDHWRPVGYEKGNDPEKTSKITCAFQGLGTLSNERNDQAIAPLGTEMKDNAESWWAPPAGTKGKSE